MPLPRPGWFALLIAGLVALTGCSPYPDGSVALRDDVHVARSDCPAGSVPRITGASVLVADEVVWSGKVINGRALAELPLLVASADVDVDVDRADELADGQEITVAIRTTTSNSGGATFALGTLRAGEAARGSDRIAEADLQPDWLSGLHCSADGELRTTSDLANLLFRWFGAVSLIGLTSGLILVLWAVVRSRWQN